MHYIVNALHHGRSFFATKPHSYKVPQWALMSWISFSDEWLLWVSLKLLDSLLFEIDEKNLDHEYIINA